MAPPRLSRADGVPAHASELDGGSRRPRPTPRQPATRDRGRRGHPPVGRCGAPERRRPLTTTEQDAAADGTAGALQLPAEERPSSYRWVVVANLWLQQEVMFLTASAVGILLPALQEDLGFSTIGAGWLGASRFIGPALLTLPASVLLARATRPLPFAALMWIAGATALVLAVVPSFWWLVAALAVHATLASFTRIPAAAVRLRWMARREFGVVMGLTLGFTAAGQSGVIAFIPFVLPWLGWRGLFVFAGLAMIGTGALWLLTMRFGRGREVRPEEPNDRPRDAGFRAVLMAGMRHREFTLIGLAMLANGGVWQGFQLFLPTFLHQERGMELTQVGIVASLMPLGGMAGTFASGWVSDRIGFRRPLIYLVAGLQPLAYIALLTPMPLPALLVLALVSGVVAWAPATVLQTVAYEVPGTSVDDVVIGQGVIRTVTTVGAISMPLVISGVATAAGSLYLGLLVIAVFPFTTAVMGWILPETGPRAQSAAA